ncbi:DNA-binding transcriptional LysR family regulator [Amycolatopsis bartoniae]|uniref:LysR family transcriptional regulator n=1 Tax=Amycolatopsis bartoniae TaxID=941986 RepID=A0A8H9MB52_9PSEU|nr:LysR family transcriptional regulator [Amycolatopsis bartoniae]MBB2935840.1 DNA-binding transcriptional LysR family regulator [Amycolatopsis bartoniae]TVT04978.1 LysR family transcriptional regulator [Amycolatopsis bartoniae]GHF62224.1 LysR family transcriptional regulator [Amycolatopsis bartoniae]
MELFHLRYFVAVAEELNYSQAARKLHMATSPLSRRVKDLERELGQELFKRSTHAVELTPAGQALLPLARDVLERVGAIPWRLREAAHGERSTVFVGVPAGLHPSLRAKLQVLAEQARGSVDLKRWPGPSAGLVEAVHDGRLALALVRLPVADPALEVAEVLAERLGAVVPADRFAGHESVRLAELTELSYVPAPSDNMPAYFEELDAALNAAGVRKRLWLPQGDYSGIAELVSSGIAFSISMLDPQSPMQLYRLENTVTLPFADLDPHLTTALAWHADRARPGSELAPLIQAAKEIFGVGGK